MRSILEYCLARAIRLFCILLSLMPHAFINLMAKLLSIAIICKSKRAYKRVQVNLLLTNLANEHNVIAMAKQVTYEFALALLETIIIVWTQSYRREFDTVSINYEADQILKKHHGLAAETHTGDIVTVQGNGYWASNEASLYGYAFKVPNNIVITSITGNNPT